MSEPKLEGIVQMLMERSIEGDSTLASWKKQLRGVVERAGSIGLRLTGGADAPPDTLWARHVARRVEANAAISSAIQCGAAYCVARVGNDEFETLEKWRRRNSPSALQAALELIALGDPFFSIVRSRLRAESSGLKPLSHQTLEEFFSLVTESFSEVDLLASWVKGESYYSKYFSGSHFCELTEIEPYRSTAPWTEALEGKTVLVIHPFDETIGRQYSENRTRIFPGTNVLPQFELLTYRPPRSHFGEIHSASHWFELFDQMVAETSELDFDVAIIGAGPFGLPLAAALKRRGKVAVHLGGATQILFGIFGKRWESDEQVAAMRNEFWTRPSHAETPPASQRRRSPYW